MIKFILFCFSLLFLPFFIIISLFNKRLRTTLSERLLLGNWSSFKKTKQKLIWIHAASVGEINGVKPILKKLKENFPEIQILTTCFSDTGKDVLKKLNQDVLILPYDNAFFAKKALEKAKPDLVLIAETEIWPSFLLELKNIPVIYFNARISDYTFKKYSFFSTFLKNILSPVEKLFAQTILDKKRFEEIGARNIEVIGNTKSDFLINDFDKNSLLQVYNLTSKDKVLVAGSVHPREDEIVIKAYKLLLKKYQNLKLIIAPRHDFEHTARVLKEQEVSFSRRSEDGNSENALLLDTIGELSTVYSLATIAYVGGSLVDVGGHNPMEPASFSVPVVMGNFNSTVRDIVEELESFGALKLVSNFNELYGAFDEFLNDSTRAKDLGEQGRQVFLESRGASNKVVEAVANYL